LGSDNGITLKNICFEAQLLSSRFTRIFGEQFVVIILDNYVELLLGTFLKILGLWRLALGQLWGCGQQLWRSFRD
jgi:hypothetical protein